MKKTKLVSLLLSAAMVISLLAGCGGTGTGGTTPPPTTGAPETGAPATGTFDISVCFASEPETMDPNLNRTTDGGMMAHHFFEALYKWVDDGNGGAVLAPGQAAGEPEKVSNPDGTVTYTFTLRDDIKWSDGQPVTAKDFVYSWQRLVTPDLAAPYSNMINMVKNANEIVAGKVDPSELGITAPDDKTLVVELTYDCPYFKEISAFPTCMPLREDVITANPKGWFRDPATYLTNGPYKMEEWVTNASIKAVKNTEYYDLATTGPDSITFKLMDDNRAMLTAFNNGELDYMQNPPPDEVATLLADGKLIPGDYLGTYYACFNNLKAPFDNPLVRKAFSLAIDRNYLVNQVTQVGEYPAGGWVPSNTFDAEGANGDDFRTVAGDYVSVDPADYEKNCAEAKALLAEAGYADGAGFPLVTYLYNTDDRHNAIAVALQQMWKTVLGVDITLDNQDWNVFLQSRSAGDYNICRNGWIADFNDPMNFLDMFMTDNGNNDSHYSSEQYDALINEALITADPVKRMDLMHQAEKLMVLEDAAIAPLFYYTQPYLISDRVQDMYYTPLGYFFFMHATQA